MLRSEHVGFAGHNFWLEYWHTLCQRSMGVHPMQNAHRRCRVDESVSVVPTKLTLRIPNIQECKQTLRTSQSVVVACTFASQLLI